MSPVRSGPPHRSQSGSIARPCQGKPLGRAAPAGEGTRPARERRAADQDRHVDGTPLPRAFLRTRLDPGSWGRQETPRSTWRRCAHRGLERPANRLGFPRRSAIRRMRLASESPMKPGTRRIRTLATARSLDRALRLRWGQWDADPVHSAASIQSRKRRWRSSSVFAYQLLSRTSARPPCCGAFGR